MEPQPYYVTDKIDVTAFLMSCGHLPVDRKYERVGNGRVRVSFVFSDAPASLPESIPAELVRRELQLDATELAPSQLVQLFKVGNPAVPVRTFLKNQDTVRDQVHNPPLRV